MWGTTHGADDDNHDFLFIMKFSSWFLWQFSLLVIILHMYFLERKEYVLSGECIRSPPPCLDLLIARIGITFGRVLPLWSFSAWRWSWWSNHNHHPISFVLPLWSSSAWGWSWWSDNNLLLIFIILPLWSFCTWRWSWGPCFFVMIIAMMVVILQW